MRVRSLILTSVALLLAGCSGDRGATPSSGARPVSDAQPTDERPTDERPASGLLPADDPNWALIQMSDRGWPRSELLPTLEPSARRGRCFADQALIPGGSYTLGEAPAPPDADIDALPGLPLQTVTLPAFCMDRYEFPNRKGEVPATCASWADAKAICGHVGKRLCGEKEWEAACRGPAQRRPPGS